MKPEWWRTFFTPSRFPIDDLVPADKTAAEIRALKKLLPRPPARVLDVACGTGRHAVRLAKLGYSVVGADQSSSYLTLARGHARRAGVKIDFIRRDMRRLGLDGRFAAGVNLWTSFGYFDTPGQDVAALRSMRAALKPGGRLILEIVDGDHVREHLEARSWAPAGRGWLLEENFWRRGKDPAVLTERIYVAPDGTSRASESFVRHYDGPRLRAAFVAAGFSGVKLRSGLLEPAAPAGLRRRILAIGWNHETR
ncbi:MAG: class I SAM-dependent methyltransferase [Elusimicrobia bacterium]|nr:class I SAM-dependent methyltransferase [Elusimicrobiota bacterium]